MKRKFALIMAVVLVIGIGLACIANQPMDEVDVQTQTYRFLLEEGFSPIQASGIMATIKRESNFDSTASSVPDGEWYGILQWGYFRRANLESFADATGRKVDDIETQLLFMIEELDIESAYYAGVYSYQGFEWIDFLEAETPREAAEIFYMVYSRPYHGEDSLTWVGNCAEEYYEIYN